ncbi:LPS assembly lipoprotein LptE [Marinobacterium sediminicola]|uniref:LPS-assembly lipoprotein LptE n=1 Tax=Marinobacterium sediminicola TaxID=518898 RepID=A0ABY1S0H8_9GAMM|nr:LPS assembly lipoprotein LptE [Marinobacterium sediminicola]ULG69646.1 LPS assembly lipoprotein LptE [Marinobacterium sediminicola]SMR74626.1 LPS-assembly lipoprotein [Marinobacterium sediminicola]
MRKHLTLPLFALLMSVMLSACGFKLRGLYDVPEALRQVALVTASQPSQIEPELRRALEINGIDISTSARYQLEVLQERHNRRTATLTGDADASEYELRSEVSFRVIDRQRDNLALMPERTITIERVYSNEASNITASASHENLIRHQMQQDMAQQIVRQYLSIKPGS